MGLKEKYPKLEGALYNLALLTREQRSSGSEVFVPMLGFSGAMLSYSLKMSVVSEFGARIHDTLSRFEDSKSVESLEDLISKIRETDKTYYTREEYEGVLSFSKEVVFRLILDMQILFKVPNLQGRCDAVEVVGDFLVFMLLTLDYVFDSEHKELQFRYSSLDEIDSLKKELNFILAFIGDTPLKLIKHMEVRDLLMKIVAMAQSLGAFGYAWFLGEGGVYNHIWRQILKMEDIKSDIKRLICQDEFFHLLSSCDNCESAIVAIESLFIVHSFIGDLEDIMSFQTGYLVDGGNGEIGTLHKLMVSSISILSERRKFSIWDERSGFRELAVQIRDTAYEAEYLIKSFATKDKSSIWYLLLRLPHVIQKMEFIENSLKEMKVNCDIGAFIIPKDVRNEDRSPLNTEPSALDHEIVVGLDEKTIEILDQLVGEPKNLQIISICGMPGLGKTTLARKLYNHPSVGVHFDRCSWSVVSQVYHRKKLLTGILLNLDNNSDEKDISEMEEESIVLKIYQTLIGRRYLIVMDDVWNSEFWDDFRRCFPDDGNGSRIIFTSRITDDGNGSRIVYTLPLLSERRCWELLEKKVFGNESICPSELEGIGRQIAANCGGLPLAVVVIAGILATMDKDESTWEKVKGSLESYLFEDPDKCMKTLELSYRHLPDHLKPCFLYFGIFKEDEEIVVSHLVRLWNAEGFVRKMKQEEFPESLGRKYLMELIDRGLVYVVKGSSTGGVKSCGIHDLLHELCLRIAEEENFMKVIRRDDLESEKHHHLRADEHSFLSWMPFSPRLCSLYRDHFIVPLPSSQEKKFLKKYYLSRYTSQEVLGYLVNVRYLYTDARLLKHNIVNLEYLVMFRPPDSLPALLGSMPKLRYLRIISDFGSLAADDGVIGSNNLEYLSSNVDTQVKALKCCLNLRKLKCKCEPILQVDDRVREYRYPDFGFLTRLESLHVIFGIWWERKLIGGISFPLSIKKLILSSFEIPPEMMSMIGKLPKLEVLKLIYCGCVGETWETNDDEFKQLRFLRLDGTRFKKWIVAAPEHFPLLQRLVLSGCYKLKEIPSEIGDNSNLQQIEIKRCSFSLEKSAKKLMEEQLDMGNIIRIIIRR